MMTLEHLFLVASNYSVHPAIILNIQLFVANVGDYFVEVKRGKINIQRKIQQSSTSITIEKNDLIKLLTSGKNLTEDYYKQGKVMIQGDHDIAWAALTLFDDIGKKVARMNLNTKETD